MKYDTASINNIGLVHDWPQPTLKSFRKPTSIGYSASRNPRAQNYTIANTGWILVFLPIGIVSYRHLESIWTMMRSGHVAFSVHKRGNDRPDEICPSPINSLRRDNRLSSGPSYIRANNNVYGSPTRGIRRSCISGLRSSSVSSCKNPGAQEHCSISGSIYKSSSLI